MRPFLWGAFGYLLLVTTAQSASFDCTKARTKIEKMICNNQELSDLDSRMDKAYKDALNVYDYYAGLGVKSDQKEWLSHTRRACNDEACLKLTYLSRIDELSASIAPRPYRVPDTKIPNAKVTIPNASAGLIHNPNENIDSFNASIKHSKKRGVINKCSTLIDISVGTAHGNNSYGGICTLSTDKATSEVLICNDELVGHLAITIITKEISNQELVDFVLDNCFGG